MRWITLLGLLVTLAECGAGGSASRNIGPKLDLSKVDTLVVLGQVYRSAWSDIELHTRDSSVVDDEYTGEQIGEVLSAGLAAPAFVPLAGLDYLARSAIHSATSTPHSRGEISQAIRDFDRQFRPEHHRKAFETAMAGELRSRAGVAPAPCVQPHGAPSLCRRSAATGMLFADIAMEPVSDRLGNVEVLTRVTLVAEPADVMQPACLIWRFRSPLDNIFNPSKNGGIDSALRRAVAKIGAETAREIATFAEDAESSSYGQLDCTRSIHKANRGLAQDALEDMR